jgi:hypothetical protein
MAEELNMVREYLLLASYCGTDNDACTETRPCAECLEMCNVFDENGVFLREFGRSRSTIASETKGT